MGNAKGLTKSLAIYAVAAILLTVILSIAYLSVRFAAGYAEVNQQFAVTGAYGKQTLCDFGGQLNVKLIREQGVEINKVLVPVVTPTIYKLELGGRFIEFNADFFDATIMEDCDQDLVTENNAYAILTLQNKTAFSEAKFLIYNLQSDEQVEKFDKVPNTVDQNATFDIYQWQDTDKLNFFVKSHFGDTPVYASIPLAKNSGESVISVVNQVRGTNNYWGGVVVTTTRGRVIVYLDEDELKVWDLRMSLKDLQINYSPQYEEVNGAFDPYKREVLQTFLVKDGQKAISFATLRKSEVTGKTTCDQLLSGPYPCDLILSALPK